MATKQTLISSLLRLSRELSLSSTADPLLSLHVSSIARKSNLLSLLFEDLLSSPSSSLSRSSILCFREILVVLQRFKSLLADYSTWSRIRLVLQFESVSNGFHELTIDLSTLLDILPLNDLDISEDVRELVALVRKQCRRSTISDSDLAEEKIRNEIRSEMLDLIREIEEEIEPNRSKLEGIFQKLGLDDSRSCCHEIEILEREIGEKACEKWSSAMISLVGLVRYSKCVLFGASTPRSEQATSASGSGSGSGSESSSTDLAIPADFRCPISLDLMKDPVVVASGQTYDRESIAKWIASGHATCPKSGQALSHPNLVPNKALKNLISVWCREQNVPFESSNPTDGESNAVISNKAALEAAKMTASFLVKNLATSTSLKVSNCIVHEIRQLTKTSSENRSVIGEAGAVPLLIPLLHSDDSSLQVNAVTALLNLSILEANKKRIAHANAAIDSVIHVLINGATWQSKENAAAMVVSLSTVHSYRKRLGRNQRILAALVSLVHAGPVSAKKDALAAILSLAGDRENVPHLLEKKVIEVVLDVLEIGDVADEAVGILAAVAKRGGAHELGAKAGAVMKLIRVLKNGSDSSREHAAAALVVLGRKVGGREIVGEIVRVPGIEWVICELMGAGTERGRRKAAALGRICRRWVAAEEAERAVRCLSAMNVTATTTMTEA